MLSRKYATSLSPSLIEGIVLVQPHFYFFLSRKLKTFILSLIRNLRTHHFRLEAPEIRVIFTRDLSCGSRSTSKSFDNVDIHSWVTQHFRHPLSVFKPINNKSYRFEAALLDFTLEDLEWFFRWRGWLGRPLHIQAQYRWYKSMFSTFHAFTTYIIYTVSLRTRHIAPPRLLNLHFVISCVYSNEMRWGKTCYVPTLARLLLWLLSRGSHEGFSRSPWPACWRSSYNSRLCLNINSSKKSCRARNRTEDSTQ